MAFRNVATRLFRQAPKMTMVGRGMASRAIGVSSLMAMRPPVMGKLALALGGVSLALAMHQAGDSAECKSSSVPYWGVPGTANERSFIAIKPDGVQRGLVGEVISRFEKKGYKLVALKLVTPTKAKAEEHYADLAKRPFFPGLVKYFSSGPIIAMVWEGPDVIKTGRKILGATNPNAADVGTIRGDFCISVGRNLIHGSDGPDSASHEIQCWFTEAEVFAWSRAAEDWITADN